MRNSIAQYVKAITSHLFVYKSCLYVCLFSVFSFSSYSDTLHLFLTHLLLLMLRKLINFSQQPFTLIQYSEELVYNMKDQELKSIFV